MGPADRSGSFGSADATDPFGDHRSIDGGPAADIDWQAIDDPVVPTPDAPLLDTGDDRSALDQQAPAHELLEAGAPLDPARTGVDIARLHPDRFRSPTADQQRALEEAYRLDPSPEALAEGINPGVWSDDPGIRDGRTENCADCARAFQDGLDGRPRVAAALGPEGLAPRGHGPVSGETADYSEQWAGRRAERLSYADLEQRVRASRGSAVVLAFGPEGGHAFNAYWDGDRGRVRWADAQVGLTGDWPPGDLAAHFPDTHAIVFDEPWRTR